MDIETIFFTIQSFFLSFYNSAFFAVIKFLLGIYVAVLLVDIILILVHMGLGSTISKTFHGVDLPPSHKGKFMKKWKGIQERLESGSSAQLKISVLEADTIVSEVLDGAGIVGENMRARLEGVHEAQVENKDRLLWAHGIRNRIVKDESFQLDEKLARDIISAYEEFLKSWETL